MKHRILVLFVLFLNSNRIEGHGECYGHVSAGLESSESPFLLLCQPVLVLGFWVKFFLICASSSYVLPSLLNSVWRSLPLDKIFSSPFTLSTHAHTCTCTCTELFRASEKILNNASQPINHHLAKSVLWFPLRVGILGSDLRNPKLKRHPSVLGHGEVCRIHCELTLEKFGSL